MNLSKKKILDLIKNLPRKIKYIIHLKFLEASPEDRQIFLSPYGLGDTYILCLFAEDWERKNNKKIHFFIKPSHEFILKWFSIEEYTVADLDSFPLYFLAAVNPWNKLKPKRILVAHMRFHLSYRKHSNAFYLGQKNLLETYRHFFSVTKCRSNHKGFMESALKNKNMTLSKIDTSNLILISPTANTLHNQNQIFWTDLKDKLLDSGFHILENTDKTYLYTQEEKKIIALNLSDIVSLGFKCKHVITFRSGLSDLFEPINEKLTVVYPNELSSKQYGLRTMYKNSLVNEVLMDNKRSTSEIITKILSIE